MKTYTEIISLEKLSEISKIGPNQNTKMGQLVADIKNLPKGKAMICNMKFMNEKTYRNYFYIMRKKNLIPKHIKLSKDGAAVYIINP